MIWTFFLLLIILFISSMHCKSLVRHSIETIPSANQQRRHLPLLLCYSSSMPPGLDTVLTSRRKEPHTIRPVNSADQSKNRTRTIRPGPSAESLLTSQRKEQCTTRTGPSADQPKKRTLYHQDWTQVLTSLSKEPRAVQLRKEPPVQCITKTIDSAA